MKTFKKTVNSPLLEISYETNIDSPRRDDNLGYFITCEKNYDSPDKDEDLKSLIQNTSEESESTEEHIEKIKTEMEFNGYGKVLAIYPVHRFEHGNVFYKRGIANGFDSSNCGFYIITDKTAEVLGTEPKDFKKIVDIELETYTKWVNGEIYYFCLYNEEGDIVESCGGYYDLEDIRADLPEEWKNEDLTEYMNY